MRVELSRKQIKMEGKGHEKEGSVVWENYAKSAFSICVKMTYMTQHNTNFITHFLFIAKNYSIIQM